MYGVTTSYTFFKERINVRTIWKKGRIVLTSILIISILACLSIFSIFSNADKKTVSSVTKGNTDYSNIERDTTITVDSNGLITASST